MLSAGTSILKRREDCRVPSLGVEVSPGWMCIARREAKTCPLLPAHRTATQTPQGMLLLPTYSHKLQTHPMPLLGQNQSLRRQWHAESPNPWRRSHLWRTRCASPRTMRRTHPKKPPGRQQQGARHSPPLQRRYCDDRESTKNSARQTLLGLFRGDTTNEPAQATEECPPAAQSKRDHCPPTWVMVFSTKALSNSCKRVSHETKSFTVKKDSGASRKGACA